MAGGGLSFVMPSFEDAGKKPDPSTLYDILIIGGGPAAMSAAIYAARKLLTTVIITKDIGGQVATTNSVENYIGFQSISGQELVRVFEEHMRSFQELFIGTGEKVVSINQSSNGNFECVLESGTLIQGKTVIIATGKRYRPLNVPGEKEFAGRGVAYCATCDAPFYKDKKVVVVGGGNSAFEAAIDLLPVAEQITMVNLVKGWQADEILQQKIITNPKMRLLDQSEITEILGKENIHSVKIKNRNTQDIIEQLADGVFVEIGLIPNSESAKELVELNEYGEIKIDCYCRTNIPGVFAAGDVTTVPEKQIIVSAGEGAKAALSAYSYLNHKKQTE